MKEENFFEKVYSVVFQIPYGRVTTYGAIASYLGLKKSARIVGWALNASRTQLYSLPAHRVVNRNGLLTGKKYFDSLGLMQQLLESEGIIIENDRVINFSDVFWDPSVELTRK